MKRLAALCLALSLSIATSEPTDAPPPTAPAPTVWSATASATYTFDLPAGGTVPLDLTLFVTDAVFDLAEPTEDDPVDPLTAHTLAATVTFSPVGPDANGDFSVDIYNVFALADADAGFGTTSLFAEDVLQTDLYQGCTREPGGLCHAPLYIDVSSADVAATVTVQLTFTVEGERLPAGVVPELGLSSNTLDP